MAAWGTVGRSSEQHDVRKPEEAREQQLYRGLVYARASSSSAAASRARMRATPPRTRERAEREAEVVAHPLGSSHGEQLLRRAGVKAVPSLWCVPHLGAGRWSSGHGRWSSGELSPIQVLELEDKADEWGPPGSDRCRGTQLLGMERGEQGRGSNDISCAQAD